MKKLILLTTILTTFNVASQTNSNNSNNNATNIERNKTIVSQFYNDVVNKGDISVIKLIMAQDFIDHNATQTQPNGIEVFKEFLTMISTAFPDIQAKIEDMISENDKVVVRITISGTQTGLLMGKIPASGKHAVWNGIDIFKIENGKIKERWSQRDLLSLMKQVGAIPN